MSGTGLEGRQCGATPVSKLLQVARTAGAGGRSRSDPTGRPTAADGPVVRARVDVTEHGCSVIASEYAHVNLRCFIDHSASFPQGSPRAHSPRARMLAHRFARDHAIRAHGNCLSFVARLVGQHAGVRRRGAETGPLVCRRTMRPHRRANRREQGGRGGSQGCACTYVGAARSRWRQPWDRQRLQRDRRRRICRHSDCEVRDPLVAEAIALSGRRWLLLAGTSGLAAPCGGPYAADQWSRSPVRLTGRAYLPGPFGWNLGSRGAGSR